MRLAAATAVYFLIVFGVGLALGPLRVLLLAPAIGGLWALVCEAPILLAAMALAARMVIARLKVEGAPRQTTIGVAAAALVIVADLVVGMGLRGMTFVEATGSFMGLGGAIYAGLLLAFALMPVLIGQGERRVRA